MSDLIHALHRLKEGSVVVLRGEVAPVEVDKLERELRERVGHDKFLVVALSGLSLSVVQAERLRDQLDDFIERAGSGR